MKQNYSSFIACLLLFCFSTAFSQGIIKGKIVDDKEGFGLNNVSVKIAGTNNLSLTDSNGDFVVDSALSSGKLIFSFFGYTSLSVDFKVDGILNLGTIRLKSDAHVLDNVNVVSIVDFAKSRKTPIAYSVVGKQEITEKLGTQEFPEILKNTPSVYTSKVGGGFGDSRIMIRGFSQENFAVMINGIPMNDMESSAVLWSNWSGLSDIASSVQVQRGLGASKLAITSVGGTMNIITRTTDLNEGGNWSVLAGNNGYVKTQASYSTGKMANGFSSSVLLSATSTDGYVNGTSANALNYFFGLGYELSPKHNFQFIFTGSPQWHHNRNISPTLDQYIKRGNGSPDIRYNREWGYLDGEEFNMDRNFYHKPIASLNWDYKISPFTKVSAVVYGAWGRGGGSSGWGRIRGLSYDNDLLRTSDGLVDFEKIRSYNSGETVTINNASVTRDQINGVFQNSASTANDTTNGISRISGINSHDWYGSILNLNNKFGEHFVLDFGFDVRTYTGIHTRSLNDLFGANVYFDNKDKNNPVRYISETVEPTPSLNPFASAKNTQSIDRNYLGKINWVGTYSQLEYTYNALTVFVQGAISKEGFKRVDYFNYLKSDPLSETSFKNILGGNVKSGANYNINKNHNVYFNSGYYSKQPAFYVVYPNNLSVVNTNLTNEKIVGLEMGYGFRNRKAFANVNLYRTSWKDRYMRNNDTSSNNLGGYYDFAGVHELHSGLEIEGGLQIFRKLKLNGMFSYGDWRYKDNVTSKQYDQAGNQIGTGKTLYLNNVKVGNTAQMTGMIGLTYEVLQRFFVDANVNYFDNLYANMDPNKFTSPTNTTLMQLPSYILADMGVSYRLILGKSKKDALNFRFNCNNLMNTIYIAESRTNILASDFISGTSGPTYASSGNLYHGIATANQVFFGFGRTWNVTLRYEFI